MNPAAKLAPETPTPAHALLRTRLYGIIDLGYVAAGDAESAAAELIGGGVGVLQLRAKDAAVEEIESLARRMLPMTTAAGVPLIINDHPEIAAATGCDGVHVGQGDVSIARAREILGTGRIVGRSTHSLAQAVAAQAEGADYVGFGPLFATPTKPGRPAIGLSEVAEVHRRLSIPVFCIGGIKEANLDAVIEAGARRVVIVSELLLAPDRVAFARRVRTRLSDSVNESGAAVSSRAHG